MHKGKGIVFPLASFTEGKNLSLVLLLWSWGEMILNHIYLATQCPSYSISILIHRNKQNYQPLAPKTCCDMWTYCKIDNCTHTTWWVNKIRKQRNANLYKFLKTQKAEVRKRRWEEAKRPVSQAKGRWLVKKATLSHYHSNVV